MAINRKFEMEVAEGFVTTAALIPGTSLVFDGGEAGTGELQPVKV